MTQIRTSTLALYLQLSEDQKDHRAHLLARMELQIKEVQEDQPDMCWHLFPSSA